MIADEDGFYDPHDSNDRLVLGLKGIINEMELHTMKVRLERGRLSKAKRGELFDDVPLGYVLNSQRVPEFQYLTDNDILLPFRQTGSTAADRIDWRGQ